MSECLTSLNKFISIFHPQKNVSSFFFLCTISVSNQCTPESMVGCPSFINMESSGDIGEHPSGVEVSFQRSFKVIVIVILKNKHLAKM